MLPQIKRGKHLYLLSLGLMLIGLIAFGMRHSHFAVHAFDRDLAKVGYSYHYRNKLFSGFAYEWHTTGHLKYFALIWRGRKIWTERHWYDDGAPMEIRPHRNGLPHGAWRAWYQDGSVKSYRFYKNGVIDGEAWAWHPNGQLSDYDYYEDGTELAHKSWISDGTPFYNYVYQDGKRVGIVGGEYCKRLSTLKR